MSDCLEVLFVSDSSGKSQTACCFNPHVGTTLMTYKGGNGPLKNCLCVIGRDYLISAEETKPLLHVWPLNSQEPSHEIKTVLPGKPSALTVSSDGSYCVGGIDGRIYVWMISSGRLLNVISKHYQAINKILFTDDSSHFVTAGEDGLVLVWKLADVVAIQCGDIYKFPINQLAPVYTFSQHSLPVTDIYIGHGSLKARLFTVSVDQTCKIYCLSSGTLLLSLMFNNVLTSLTVNDIETKLFVGTNLGNIQFINIDPYPRSLEHHVSEDTNILNVLVGHSGRVNTLSTSMDGVTLASGAEDSKVLLWNVPGKQLIRSLDMKGSVSNIFFFIASDNIFSSNFNPSVVVKKFENVCNVEEKSLEVNILVKDSVTPISFSHLHAFEEKEKESSEKSNGEERDIDKLKQEIFKLKEINKQLYQFAVSKLLNNSCKMDKFRTMAQIHDRKSNFYSQKQSVREELSAPQYLESAGDELIKCLAKKQTNTSTSLQEQLEIVQNFEKGFELNPDNRKGVTSLKDFKKHVFDEQETSTSQTKREEIPDVNELMRITGLSRHELELGLCEKPSSKTSQLYMFAIQNKRQKERREEEPEKRLFGHPINHLKEIEKEFFDKIKTKKYEIEPASDRTNQDKKVEEKIRKKKKQRKRKKKTKGNPVENSSKELTPKCESLKTQEENKEEEHPRPSSSRPSLWDVKDMKKWSESKKIGCKPQAFYTIKNGKIIKLQKEYSEGETT